MNFSTKQLQAFLLTAELGSFTRAAERLHVTQAGMSSMIRGLEQQLGARLFERTTRNVSVTQAGEILRPVAARAVADLLQVTADIARIEAQSGRTLRVGATPLVANDLLPLAYAKHRVADPMLNLEITSTHPTRIPPMIDSGELDLGFGIFPNEISGLERERIFSSRLYCVTASDMPLEGSPLLSISRMPWTDLAGLPMVSLDGSNPYQQLVDSLLPAQTRVGPTRRIVNHIETQIAMVAIGMGWAAIPSFALQACRHHNIKVFEMTPAVDIDFYRLSKKGRQLPLWVDTFCAHIVSALGEVMRPR